MADFNTEDSNIRFQSSLGSEFKRLYKEGSNIDRISLARVTRVNYRYNTVDVSSGSIGGNFSSNSTGGGRFSAKLPVQFGGTTIDGQPFGQINPIEIGTLVLIGFIEGNKTTPIVLGIYGREEESIKLSRTPFEGVDPSDRDLKGLTQQQFTVYPSLTYKNIDGVGNRTVSFTGKSFVTFEADASPELGGVTDRAEGTEYEDLDTSYYYTGELIEPTETRAPVILFKHQGDKFSRDEDGKEEDNHKFMWFLDQDGTYRTSLMQEDEDWRAFFEMTPEGTIQMVRNNDTKDVRGSTDQHSIGVEPDGVRIRVGDKYSLITPDGTYGTLGLGLGGGGGSIPPGLLDDINETLDLANRKILEMGTYIEQTESFITMGANLLEDIEGEMVEYQSNFTILAEEIRSSVSETRLRGLVNEELDAFMGDLDELNREAEEHLEIIRNIVDDGLVSPSEKQLLAPTYQGIKVEYPAYIDQAEKNDRPTGRYTQAYEELVDLMEPIMSAPTETSSVDPLEVQEAYSNYFNARQEILAGVLTALQRDMRELAEETSKVALEANKALGDAADAMGDASKALTSLENIAETDKVTPQEKPGLKRNYEEIQVEFESLIEQASEFEVSYLSYENAYDALDNFISNTGVFDNMNETTELNGEMYYQLVEGYYRERIALSTAIAKETKAQLSKLSADFEYYNTQIVETSREIALIADSVVANEDSIEVAQGRLSVMADRVGSRVTKSTFRREIDENRNTLNATGKNLYVQATQLEDNVLEPGTGETVSSSGGAVSAYIQVSGGVMYNVAVFDNNVNNTLTYAFYDTQGNFLKGDSTAVNAGESQVDLVAPSPTQARFMKASLTDVDPAKIQVERGNGSGFFMYSNQDLLNNLSYATDEKENREIAWRDKSTKRDKALSNGTIFLQDLDTALDDSVLTVEEAETLSNEVDTLLEEFESIQAEAEELDVQTVTMEIALTQLESTRDQYITPILEAEEDETLSQATRDLIMEAYERYINRRDDYYSLVEEMFRASYDASVEVLDEVMAGSLEAERIARETAIAAERAAQSVSTVEYEIATGNEMENRHIDTARRISEDGVLNPVEKEEGLTLINEIVDEFDWFIAQGRAIGLSTSDLENAYNQLTAYYSAFVTSDKVLKDSEVNSQTFVGHFQTYHASKLNFLQGMLQEARRKLTQTEEQAQLARNETYRRDQELQQMRNILDDSEIAIERIEEKVDELSRTHFYIVELLSTNGFTFFDRVVNTTLETTVYRNSDDITEDIPNAGFEWIKVKSNGDIDQEWTDEHKGVGPKIDLTHEDVKGKATFTVEVYVEEESDD